MESIINLGLLAVMGFFMATGFLFGLMRGLWKTTFRTVWLLITMLILLFVTPMITNALLDVPINVAVSIPEFEIETISTVRDTVNVVLTKLIGIDMIENYPVLAEIILSLPAIIINIVLFILLFFVTKILLLPISAIIYRLIVGKEKKVTTKKADGSKQTIKKSKHRFVGALVGLTTGIVVSFSILMPVVAVSDMLSKNKVGKVLEDNMGTSVIREYTDAYEKSIVATIYNTTGLTYLSNVAFGHLTTVNIEGKQIRYADDITNIFNTYAKTMTLLNKSKEYMGDTFNAKDLTKAQLSEILSLAHDVLDMAQDVTFVDSINDVIVPLIVDYLEVKNIKLSDDADINEAMVNVLKNISTSITVDGKEINIFGELSAIVDIAIYLNDCDMLLPLLQLNKESINTSILALDDNFSTTLTNKLFNLQTVDITAPNLINLGVICLNKALEIDYDEDHTITTEVIKNTLAGIIDSSLDVYTSLDFDTKEIYTSTTFEAVGRMLDTVKNSTILSTETYHGLIDFAFGFLEDMAGDIVPSDYKNVYDKVFSTLPTTIKSVTSWEQDLKKIYSAMQLMTGENGILSGSFDAKNAEHMVNLGKTCDILASTELLGTKVNLPYVDGSTNKIAQVPFISFILYEGINDLKPLLERDLTGSKYVSLLSVLGDVQTNIINLNYDPKTNTKFFEDDFKNLAPVVELVLSTMDGEEIELDSSTGEALDKLKQTKLIGNDTTAKLVADLIDIIAEDINLGDETINATVTDVLNDVQLRLNSTALKTMMASDNTFWATEMTHIKNLMNIEFSGANALDNIPTTGATIDKIVQGDLPFIRQSALLLASDFRKIIATTIESLTTTILQNLTSGSAEHTAVNNAVTSIVANYKDNDVAITSFEQELTHLRTMQDIDPNVFSAVDSTNARNLGAKLDSIAYNSDEAQNSTTITKTIVDKIIYDCMGLITVGGSSPAYITTAINSIKENIDGVYKSNIAIVGWEQELVHLYNASNIEDQIVTNIDELNTTKATAIGNTLDSLAYNYNADDEKDTASNSKIVTASILSTLITNLVNTLKNTDPGASNSDKLTNKILDNMASASTLLYTDEYYVGDTTTQQAYLYTDIFTDLVYIKDEMANIQDAVDTPSIDEIDGSTATQIDTTLENIQSKRVAGIITTREIAIEILDSIADSTYRDAADYAKSFYEYLNTNIASTTSEDYFDSTDSTFDYTTTPFNYTNGFRKVFEEFDDGLGSL